MRRLVHVLKNESEDAMRAGGLMAFGLALAFATLLSFAAAIAVAVAAATSWVWGCAAGGAFTAVIAGVCLLLSMDEEEPPARRQPTHPEYSAGLALMEDLAADFIESPARRRPAAAMTAALAAGALIGAVETLNRKKS